DGFVRVVCIKVTDDGERVGEPHLSGITPGTDPDWQMGYVNQDLGRRGQPQVADNDLARLRAVTAAVHTPATVAAFRENVLKSELDNAASRAELQRWQQDSEPRLALLPAEHRARVEAHA